MNLVDVVKAALSEDDLLVRAWSLDVRRDPSQLANVPRPTELTAEQLSVAAGLVELACTLLGTLPPAWVNDVGASPVDLYLPARVRDLPRTRALIFQQTPEPLKKRHVYASEDYLSVV